MNLIAASFDAAGAPMSTLAMVAARGGRGVVDGGRPDSADPGERSTMMGRNARTEGDR